MSNELFDKTCTEALGEHWSAFTSASENRSLKKLYAHMHKRIAGLEEAVRASCKRIVSTNEMPEWDDVYQILIPVLHQSGGGADD